MGSGYPEPSPPRTTTTKTPRAQRRGRGEREPEASLRSRHPAHFARKVRPNEVLGQQAHVRLGAGDTPLNRHGPSSVTLMTKLCGARRSERSERRQATHSEFPLEGRCRGDLPASYVLRRTPPVTWHATVSLLALFMPCSPVASLATSSCVFAADSDAATRNWEARDWEETVL